MDMSDSVCVCWCVYVLSVDWYDFRIVHDLYKDEGEDWRGIAICTQMDSVCIRGGGREDEPEKRETMCSCREQLSLSLCVETTTNPYKHFIESAVKHDSIAG